MTDGIRSEWAAEAEISFGPRYRTIAQAREGVRVWSEVCRDTLDKIDRAQASGNAWFVDYQTVRLAGYRAELEHAAARVVELEARTIDAEMATAERETTQ